MKALIVVWIAAAALVIGPAWIAKWESERRFRREVEREEQLRKYGGWS